MHHRTNLPVLGIAAASGTGKTTLLTRVIPILNQKGLRVAILKHAHHETSVDQPGKDSYRLREAGAATVMLSTASQRIILHTRAISEDPDLDTELSFIDHDAHDLVLVEGFKRSPIPKIALHRRELGHRMDYGNDPFIIAIATDDAASMEAEQKIPLLDINNPDQVACFMMDFFRAQSTL